MNNTYLEVNKDSTKTVQLDVWRDNGEAYAPSGAFYRVKGREKDNIIISRTQAQVGGKLGNEIWFTLTDTVTASADAYDIRWEIRKNDDITYHCTKLLVVDQC